MAGIKEICHISVLFLNYEESERSDGGGRGGIQKYPKAKELSLIKNQRKIGTVNIWDTKIDTRKYLTVLLKKIESGVSISLVSTAATTNILAETNEAINQISEISTLCNTSDPRTCQYVTDLKNTIAFQQNSQMAGVHVQQPTMTAMPFSLLNNPCHTMIQEAATSQIHNRFRGDSNSSNLGERLVIDENYDSPYSLNESLESIENLNRCVPSVSYSPTSPNGSSEQIDESNRCVPTTESSYSPTSPNGSPEQIEKFKQYEPSESYSSTSPNGSSEQIDESNRCVPTTESSYSPTSPNGSPEQIEKFKQYEPSESYSPTSPSGSFEQIEEFNRFVPTTESCSPTSPNGSPEQIEKFQQYEPSESYSLTSLSGSFEQIEEFNRFGPTTESYSPTSPNGSPEQIEKFKQYEPSSSHSSSSSSNDSSEQVEQLNQSAHSSSHSSSSSLNGSSEQLEQLNQSAHSSSHSSSSSSNGSSEQLEQLNQSAHSFLYSPNSPNESPEHIEQLNRPADTVSHPPIRFYRDIYSNASDEETLSVLPEQTEKLSPVEDNMSYSPVRYNVPGNSKVSYGERSSPNNLIAEACARILQQRYVTSLRLNEDYDSSSSVGADTNGDGFKLHSNVKNLISNFCCIACGKEGTGKDTLERYMCQPYVSRKHFNHKGPLYTCTICYSKFASMLELRLHIHLKHPALNLCNYCECASLEKDDLLLHTDEMHSSDLKSIGSNDCLRDILDQIHQKMHFKAFDCFICISSHTTEAELKKHLFKNHKVVLIYGCGFCTFTCFDIIDLTEHLLIHQEVVELAEYSVPQVPKEKVPCSETVFRCIRCDFTCTAEHTMEVHQGLHKTVGKGGSPVLQCNARKRPHQSDEKKEPKKLKIRGEWWD